jgi:hypothetical protein
MILLFALFSTKCREDNAAALGDDDSVGAQKARATRASSSSVETVIDLTHNLMHYALMGASESLWATREFGSLAPSTLQQTQPRTSSPRALRVCLPTLANWCRMFAAQSAPYRATRESRRA